MKRYLSIVAVVFCVVVLFSCGQQEPPLLFVPSDLEVTLWAESPMFYNPTNMDVDARGRVWITEAVNYRTFNNDTTRNLFHPDGDRIVILEDTDHDGKADAAKVFVQDKDLHAPLGIAVIGNSVYVSSSPHLIVYRDDDGDDVADSKEILLSGFGGFDHDHSLHAVVGGPDGQLYFNTGNAGPHHVTDRGGWMLRSGSVYTGGSPYNLENKGNIKSDDGRIWVGGLALRMNPQGEQLRVLAHNFRNAFELYVDSRGDLWQNDNDDEVMATRTTWLMEGGNAGYFSTDGTRMWSADQRPWQDIFTAHWHQEDPGVIPAGDNAGAGAPTGVVINEGDGLGKKYRGMLLSADAGRNAVFAYHPEKKGAGFELGTRNIFVSSLPEDNTGYVWNDPHNSTDPRKWFRPSDVTFGTDGALYVADWYDPVVGGHQMQDSIGYGRIYRITRRGKNPKSPVFDLTTVAGQMKALQSPAINVRYTAAVKLMSTGDGALPEVTRLLESENSYHRFRAVWLMARLGPRGRDAVTELLRDNDEEMRLVALRALRQVDPENILEYAKVLVHDPSAQVRREVTITLSSLPWEQTHDLLVELAVKYDGTDRWYLEALGYAAEGHASDFYNALLKAFDSEDDDPIRWDPRFASLVWRLHPPEAVTALRRRADAPELSQQHRSMAVTALGFINTREAVEAMLALSESRDEAIGAQARYWLTFRQGNAWSALWDWSKTNIDLAYEKRVAAATIRRNRIVDEKLTENVRKNSIRDLARDHQVGVPVLLGLVSDNKINTELLPFVAELLTQHENPVVRAQAARFFPDSVKSTLRAADVALVDGSVHSGEEKFRQYCTACHKVNGRGGDIGPDLSGIGRKFDRRGLAEAMVDPDAGVAFAYEAWTIKLKDGQARVGFIVAESEQTITLRDMSGRNHVIPAPEVASKSRWERSLMPPAQTLGLSATDVADIVAYLAQM